MAELVGTAKVGSTPAMVLGPIDRDVLLMNQSAQKMLIWLGEDLEVPPVELTPYQQHLAPFGSPMVMAQAPMARPGQAYTLFYSQVADLSAAVTQG